MRENGLPLDATILPLLPRSLLWLARIDESVVIEPCISSFSVFYRPNYQSTDEYIINVGLKVFVQVDGQKLEVQSMTGMVHQSCGAFQGNNASDDTAPYHGSWLGSLWRGYVACAGRQMGPIAKAFDRFFAPIAPNKQQIDGLIFVEAQLRKSVILKLKELAPQFDIADAGVAAKKAMDALKVFSLTILLGGDALPESDVIYAFARQPEKLMTPQLLKESLTVIGEDPKVTLNNLASQVQDIKNLANDNMGRSLEGPVDTPVDATVSTLELLKRNLQVPVPQ